MLGGMQACSRLSGRVQQQSRTLGSGEVRRRFSAAPWKSDAHVTIVPYFTVPDGKMDEFKSLFPKFYAGVRAGTDECLYYGFAVRGNQVFCREGYMSADGALAHVGDVNEHLNAALGLVGEGGLDLSVMGPAAELEKMKGPLGLLGAKFWELESGSMWRGCASGPDTHVTVVPYLTIPDGKMDEFRSLIPKFYASTKAGTGECLYYGFAVHGNKVLCREGYAGAEAVLAHLGEVKESLDAAISLVGEGGLDLSIVGPAAELEKLKGPLEPMGAKFWEQDTGSLWK